MRRETGTEQGAGTRFRPGQSGNPKGRPVGIAAVSRALKAVLEEETVIQTRDDGGRKKVRMTKAEAVARALVSKAQQGSVAAASFITERTDGKVKEAFDQRDRRREELMKLSKTDPKELLAHMERVVARLKNFGSQGLPQGRNDGARK